MLPSFSYTNVLLSLAALLFVKLFFFNHGKQKKNYPPSPLALPIIGHLYLFKNPLPQTLATIFARYGPITFLRLGSRPVIVVNSRAVAEECFTIHDLAFANRVQFPSKKHISSKLPGIGGANYGPHWRNTRRIAMVNVLTTHRLLSSADARAEEVCHMAKRLLSRWKKIAGAEGSTAFAKVELKSRLFELSLNITTQMIGGKRYCGEEAEVSEGARRFKELVEEQFSKAEASSLSNFLPILGFSLEVNKKAKKVSARSSSSPKG